MWLFPTDPNNPNDPYYTYTLTATPPSGSPFVTFNISNLSISSDKDIVVVLQFVHDAPVTTANLSPPPDANGEYPDPTTVALSATALSGFTVAATYYSIDAGPNQTYTVPFTVLGVGPHTIRYWSVDSSGVFELPNSRTFTLRPSNTAPVALSKNVTVPAGASCTANASIDDGSFDSDVGDTITLTQTPAGPYPLGQTTVTLTVTDNHGASSSGQAIVTVEDTTAPVITCPGNVVVTLPANSSATSMAVSFPAPAATDNCAAPTVLATPASGSVFPVGTTTVNVTATDGAGNQSTCSFTVTVLAPQLTALSPAQVWLGLKNSDDVGTNFDLLAEVLKNGSVVGSGQLNNVPGGSSGFNNAVLRTINLALSSQVNVSAGDTLRIRLSVRIAVGVTGHRSGTARLWFNDAAASSRFGAAIGGATSDYFLRDGFALGTAAGPGPKKTIDVLVDRAVGGNPFKPFGTWSKTF
jgi:hypothetical protein